MREKAGEKPSVTQIPNTHSLPSAHVCTSSHSAAHAQRERVDDFSHDAERKMGLAL
jgi:hypothetical protein